MVRDHLHAAAESVTIRPGHVVLSWGIEAEYIIHGVSLEGR